MDPISRESSPSYLPIAGLIAGIVGLILGAIALVNSSKANSAAAAAAEQSSSQASRIDGIESTAANASAAADRAVSGIASLKSSTQEGFNMVAAEFGKTNGELAKLQEAATRAARPAASGSTASSTSGSGAAKTAEPAVAGPGEYVVKAGDTGYKIATANGVSVADLQAVNPGVSWTALKVGQKLKLPKK